MSLNLKVFKGAAVLGAGEGLAYGCSFIRNMILARLLSKADFGIAAAFAITMSLFEMTSKIGMSRFIVRDPQGGALEFIASAHFVQFSMAILSALVMLGGAWPLTEIFGLGDHRWAFMSLAAIALLKGFENLDARRQERDLRFTPTMAIEVVPQVVILLLTWPLAKFFGDFRAMLALLVTKELISCITSHVVANHRYKLLFHREYVTRMVRFGWPLLVTGFLSFLVMQGGQFLVGAFFTMPELGAYAAASTLTMAPTFLFGRVFNSLMLPILARDQNDTAAFHNRYLQCVGVLSVFSVFGLICFIIGAEGLMRLVYGSKYAGGGVILAWLAAANALRNVRLAPALAAIARGDSKNEMYATGCRVLGIVIALIAAIAHQPLWVIAASGVAGELIACFASFVLLQRRDGIQISEHSGAIAWVICAAAGSFFIARSAAVMPPVTSVSLAAFVALVACAFMLFMAPRLRYAIVRTVSSRSTR
jgi:O-antigen/teichoic acid export membrane protein